MGVGKGAALLAITGVGMGFGVLVLVLVQGAVASTVDTMVDMTVEIARTMGLRVVVLVLVGTESAVELWVASAGAALEATQ